MMTTTLGFEGTAAHATETDVSTRVSNNEFNVIFEWFSLEGTDRSLDNGQACHRSSNSVKADSTSDVSQWPGRTKTILSKMLASEFTIDR